MRPISAVSRRARDGGLRAAEKLLLARDATPARPQLFILGLPRSGTTLVYQYIVHRLAVSYFTNGVGRYPDTPCTITWLQRRLHGDYRSDFRSSYGKVSGAVAPREAGAFWGRFFGYEAYVGSGELAPRDVDCLRRTVAAVERGFGGAPFVNKNVKHMLRIPALAEVFPDARFLVVDRDPAAIALSVWRARTRNGAGPDAWWSVKPRDHAELRLLPPAQQVTRQLESLSTGLADDISRLDPGRVLKVAYGDFCTNPEALIATVRKSLGPVPERRPAVTAFDAVPASPKTAEEQALLRLVA